MNRCRHCRAEAEADYCSRCGELRTKLTEQAREIRTKLAAVASASDDFRIIGRWERSRFERLTKDYASTLARYLGDESAWCEEFANALWTRPNAVDDTMKRFVDGAVWSAREKNARRVPG